MCSWCGPCKILGPRLEKAIAKQEGRVAMAKVDIDEHTDLAIEYGVRTSSQNSHTNTHTDLQVLQAGSCKTPTHTSLHLILQ